MMPMATTSSTSGRPTPITISRAVPPPSGSLGMSPSDWKIRSASGTAVATTSTAADQPLGLWRASGAFCAGACGAASATASQRDQAAPRPATRTASGTPNNATRLQGAARMDGGRDRDGRHERKPVACRNRECQRRRRGAALFRLRAAGHGAQERREQRERGRGRSREPGDKSAQRRQSGRAGVTPRIAIWRRASRRRRLRPQSPATKPAATMTRPGEVIACAKPAPKALPTKAVEKPAARPKTARPPRSPETPAAAAPGSARSER